MRLRKRSLSCRLRTASIALFLCCNSASFLCYAQSNSCLHLPDAIHTDTRLTDLRNDAFVFQNSEDSEIISDAVVRWGKWQGIVGQQAVWLSDGSWLAGQIISIDEKSILLQNRWLNLESISISSVRALIFSPSASLNEWNTLSDQLSGMEGESDIVLLLDGSRLTGVIDLSINSETPLQSFAIQIDQKRLILPWTSVSTIAMSPALFGPTQLDSKCTSIGLEDGSQVNVVRKTNSRQHIELEIPSLGKVKSHDPPAKFVRAVRCLSRERIPNVVRLDSLEPANYRFLPDSELTFSLGVNRSVFGTPLVVGQRSEAGLIAHGLAMHSSSQVAFRWDQSPGKFLAEACMAEQPDGELKFGDSVCKVLLGKSRDLTLVKEFELSRRIPSSAHQTIEVDLTGAQLVVLLVEKARFGQWGDQVFWLDARFFKQPIQP